MDGKAENLVTNGDFSDGLAGWVVGPSKQSYRPDTYLNRSALHCSDNVGLRYLQQEGVVLSAGWYRASVSFARLASSAPRLHMLVIVGNKRVARVHDERFGDKWEGHWVEFEVPNAGQLALQLTIAQDDLEVGGEDLALTDIEIRRLEERAPDSP
jgi:hypothetical protein